MSDRALIIPAAYTKLSTLADGTLRIVLDVEPRHMADAFALFAKESVPHGRALTNEGRLNLTELYNLYQRTLGCIKSGDAFRLLERFNRYTPHK